MQNNVNDNKYTIIVYSAYIVIVLGKAMYDNTIAVLKIRNLRTLEINKRATLTNLH